MRLLTKFGIGFVCSALLLLGGWWLYLETRRCQPVYMPLATFVGDVRTREFTVNITNRYFIQLEAQKTILLERLNCLLGMREPPTQDCSKLSSVVDVGWALSSGGRVVQRGSSADSPYGGWSADSIYRELGYFNGEAGHTYRLDLHFVTDATQLSVTNPHLRVSVNPVFIEAMLFMTGLVIYPTVCVLLLIGIVLLLVSFFRGRASRKRAQPHVGVQ